LLPVEARAAAVVHREQDRLEREIVLLDGDRLHGPARLPGERELQGFAHEELPLRAPGHEREAAEVGGQQKSGDGDHGRPPLSM
jgi:hypothetical protein